MKRTNSSFFFVLAVLLLTTGTLAAQDANYQLALTDGEGRPGDTVDITVTLDTTLGDDIQGYQWGVCHDDTMVSIGVGDVVNGSSIEDVNFTFQAVNIVDGEGWTVGSLLDVIAQEVLTPDNYTEMFVATYTIEGENDTPDAIPTDLEFCGDLGSPVVTVRVVVSGEEIEPEVTNGVISILGIPDDPFYLYALTDETAIYNSNDPGVVSVVTTMSILELEDVSPDFPSDTQGFQMGVRHDGAVLNIVDAEPFGVIADLNDNDGPGFFGVNFDPFNGPGVTVGVVYALTGGVFVQFDVEKDTAQLTYEAADGVLAGDEDGLTTLVEWGNDLGDPVLPNSVVVAGASFDADFTNATITFEPVTDIPFIRGDANDDGIVNIADPVRIFSAVMVGDSTIDCNAAGDGNSDGKVDIADGIFILHYRFLNGEAPAEPFPGCDTDEGVDCEVFNSCP